MVSIYYQLVFIIGRSFGNGQQQLPSQVFCISLNFMEWHSPGKCIAQVMLQAFVHPIYTRHIHAAESHALSHTRVPMHWDDCRPRRISSKRIRRVVHDAFVVVGQAQLYQLR